VGYVRYSPTARILIYENRGGSRVGKLYTTSGLLKAKYTIPVTNKQ